MEPLVRQPRALAELTDDTEITSPNDYSVLMWNGSKWVDAYPIWAVSGGLGMNPFTEITGNNKLIQWTPLDSKFTDSGKTVDDFAPASHVGGNIHIDWTNAGNTDFLSTGTIKTGGADAADVPLTLKAHTSQSGNFCNFTDSAGDISFKVNKHGRPAPTIVMLNSATYGLDHDGYLEVSRQAMSATVGFTQITSGCVTGFAIIFKISAIAAAEETVTWAVSKKEWGVAITELFHRDVVVPNASPAWTEFQDLVSFNRGVYAFGQGARIMVSVSHTGGANVKVTMGIASVEVLLDQGTELTTIS